MQDMTPFIYYLISFRLAIIAAGITSIVLGYLLFLKGVFPFSSAKESIEGEYVTAEVAGNKFTLKNAAPGTCFGLFGMFIIVVMLVTGNPEVTFEFLENSLLKATMRGNRSEFSEISLKKAISHLEQGDKILAYETAEKTLYSIAAPLNDLAWVLLKTDGDINKANLLAKLSVSVHPDEPSFLHTLAEIQYALDDKQNALLTLEKAQSLRPSFTEQLNKWRSEIK